MKQCSKCKEIKSLSSFCKDKYKKDGLQCRCKDCRKIYEVNRKAREPEKMKAQHTRWRNNNRDHLRNVSYQKLYGITLEEYNMLLEEQGGNCAICSKPPDSGRAKYLYVDHCHNTIKIRGLLCSNCNKGIGFFRDDPELIEKAINYLRGV